MSKAESLLTLSRPTVSIRILRSLAEQLERIGVSRERIANAFGFTGDVQGDDHVRILSSDAHRYFEQAVELSGDAAFGLHWAEAMNLNSFGPISQLVAHASTLGQALGVFARYHQLLADPPSFAREDCDDLVVFRCLEVPGANATLQHFVAELAVGAMSHLLESFSYQARPQRVYFAYSSPPYKAEYDRVFKGIESFEQPFTGIVLDRSQLTIESSHKDETVFAALRAIAEGRLLRFARRVPFAHLVRERILSDGHRERTGMASIARELGISERSLRRRLEAEGTTFHAVAEESRSVFAKALVRSGTVLDEVAEELGFADTSSFYRAFKRWTGVTPGEFRAVHTNSSTGHCVGSICTASDGSCEPASGTSMGVSEPPRIPRL